jgi:hypothetical protein
VWLAQPLLLFHRKRIRSIKTFRAFLVVSAVLLLLVGVHSTSYADAAYFELRLSDGVNTVTVLDGSAADSSGGAGIFDGVISYIGPVGLNWALNVTTGITYPTLGSTSVPSIDLNSVNLSSLGAGTLTLHASALNFTAVPLSARVDVGGTTDGTVTLKEFYNNSNVYLGGTQFASLGPFSGGVGSAFSGSGNGFVPGPTAPYSLTTEAEISHTGAGQLTSFNVSLTTVPEPLSFIFLGCSLLGIVAFRKKLKK